MRLSGAIDGFLRGGTQSKRRGLLPFFATTVVEEHYAADALLRRLSRALGKMEITDVANLWIGDAPVYELPDDEDDPAQLEELLDRAWPPAAGAGFEIMLLYEDDALLYDLTITYRKLHDSDSPGLTVQISAEDADWDEEGEAPEEGGAWDAGDEGFAPADDEEIDYEQIVEAFMDRLAAELTKEIEMEPELYGPEIEGPKPPEMPVAEAPWA